MLEVQPAGGRWSDNAKKFLKKIESSEIGRDNTLSFDVPGSSSIVLRAPSPDLERESSWHLPVESTALRCVDGFYELPVREMNATVEGTWLNSQTYRRFGALDDGSLVYYEQFGPLKSFASRVAFTHRFYRFRRAGPK